jgi:hypothetical protein
LMGRDPWFERLTTLSEVEGESRKIGRNQIIVDPGSRPARQDLAGMTWPLMRGGQACPGLDPGERVRRKKT